MSISSQDEAKTKTKDNTRKHKTKKDQDEDNATQHNVRRDMTLQHNATQNEQNKKALPVNNPIVMKILNTVEYLPKERLAGELSKRLTGLL